MNFMDIMRGWQGFGGGQQQQGQQQQQQGQMPQMDPRIMQQMMQQQMPGQGGMQMDPRVMQQMMQQMQGLQQGPSSDHAKTSRNPTAEEIFRMQAESNAVDRNYRSGSSPLLKQNYYDQRNMKGI